MRDDQWEEPGDGPRVPGPCSLPGSEREAVTPDLLPPLPARLIELPDKIDTRGPAAGDTIAPSKPSISALQSMQRRSSSRLRVQASMLFWPNNLVKGPYSMLRSIDLPLIPIRTAACVPCRL